MPKCEYCEENEATIAIFFKKPVQHKDAASFAYSMAQYGIDKAEWQTIEEQIICEDCYVLISKKPENEKTKLKIMLNLPWSH